MTSKPIAIDLFCGLGGWSEGLLAGGWDVFGFDIERHVYWVPEESAEQDGRKGTKPIEKRGWTQGCAVSLGMEGQGAQPRTRMLEYPAQLVLQDVLTIDGAQFKDADLIVASPPCQEYSYMAMPWSLAKAKAAEYRDGTRDIEDLNRLFNACFRIQKEACEAAGKHIPMIVENVRGAQPWVGRARWNFGSFYLWGDVPALMPQTIKARKHDNSGWRENGTLVSSNRMVPSGHKNPGFRFDGSGKSFQSESVNQTGIKGSDGYDRDHPNALGWGKPGTSSKSPARKAASAMIAKIPEPLSRHIASTFYPRG